MLLQNTIFAFHFNMFYTYRSVYARKVKDFRMLITSVIFHNVVISMEVFNLEKMPVFFAIVIISLNKTQFSKIPIPVKNMAAALKALTRPAHH